MANGGASVAVILWRGHEDMALIPAQILSSLCETAASLAYPPDRPRNIASPDGKTLYHGAQQVESSIWIVRRTAAKRRWFAGCLTVAL